MLKGRNILSLIELSSKEVLMIIDVADALKSEAKAGVFRKPLENKSLAMLFEKPSTRTMVSFDCAMFELGGHSLNLATKQIQTVRGESLEDTARVLSRYAHGILARVYKHEDLLDLVRGASVPVINALSDRYHPCAVLGDLQTLREKKGKLEGLKLTYVGDGNNMANSLLVGCAKCAVNVSVATPRDYRPLQEAVDAAKEIAKENGSVVEIVDDPYDAVVNADAVYTDVWISMGMEKENEARMRVFKPRYQVNARLLEKAKRDVIFMHCLPMHRGLEVTAEIADGPHSIVWDQVENRLYTHKAILALLLADHDRLPLQI